MTDARYWRQVSDYAWQCSPWTVCSVSTNGVVSFELWHEKQPRVVGRHASKEEAFAAAKEAEKRGEG